MKIYSTILLLFLSSALFAQFQWSNPLPSGYINNGVVFTDAQNGFIINTNGDLLSTSDQGVSWHFQQNFSTGNTIDYKDSTLVIGAFGSVYVSTDQGQSWAQHPISQTQYVTQLHVISRDTIFLVSSFESETHLFTSVDRGTSWQIVNTTLTLKSFWMLNGKDGFATSYNGIYKTTDGGVTWTQPDTTAKTLSTFIQFRDTSFGLAFGGDQFFRTTDGGLHWATVLSFDENVQALAYIGIDTIVAVTDGGVVARSTDAGTTWTLAPTGPSESRSLLSICFDSHNTGFSVGFRGRILKTIDGGVTWSEYAPTYSDIQAVNFATTNEGYAADRLNMYKTINGGDTWQSISFSPPTSLEQFKYIHFFSKDSGFALSDQPVRAYKTYNAGASWHQIDLNDLYNDEVLGVSYFNRIIYLSTNGAYGSQILLSTDAGETWSVQNNIFISTNNPTIKNPLFIDGKTGYGTMGYNVYKTVDSARTWTQQPMFPYGLLQSLCFSNDTTGYATVDGSYVLKTSDSGHTWTQLFIGHDIMDNYGGPPTIRFFDNRIGYLTVGRYVFRTIDSGNTWTQHDFVAWPVSGMEMRGDSTLFIYGLNGSILKRSVRTYEIDPLALDSTSSCSTKLSAMVSAVFSSIDSAWFQYGTSDFSNEFVLTAATTTDTARTLTAVITGLSQNTIYKARVKILYQGKYYYGDPIQFVTQQNQAPDITTTGATLVSSSSAGNQWYKDGVAIPGATQVTYTPTQSGNYSVAAVNDGCSSPMSAQFAYYVTGVTNVLPPTAIKIYPNPVHSTLIMENNDLRTLNVKVLNSIGTLLHSEITTSKQNRIDMQGYASGTYFIIVTEVHTLKTFQKVVVKL